MTALVVDNPGAALRFALGLIGALLASLSGCAPQPARPQMLATYRWTNATDALGIMRQRAQSVRTVSAQCLITLTRRNGESVRLDGALVMAPHEGNVRLRAWKLNQPVIDLTLNRDGLWIEAPREDSRRQQMLPANLNAAQAARAILLFGGGLLQGPDMQVIDRGGPQFQIRKRLETGQLVRATVDRATLVVRKYELLDPSGAARFTMVLSHYDKFSGVSWPTQFVATSPSGKVEIDLRQAEINTSIPQRAFVPPPRAEKVQ